MSGTALPTAQVNGVVWTQAVVNGVDYVGGSFTESQPAGAADGVDVTSRANLFAYNVATGVALPGFSATTNAQVRGITASPDGSRLYIVGDFTQVNGQARNHVAALSLSGDLLGDFVAGVNAAAYSVSVKGSTVYVGGAFTSAGGSARTRAAAFTSAGALLPWSPSVGDRVVRAIAVSPDGTKVLLGGSFISVNGQTSPGQGMAAVDSVGGNSDPWPTGQLVHDGGENSAIYSLSSRGGIVYATGYEYGNLTVGNFEGTVAMNWSDGTVKWLEDCHGDTYSSVPFNDAVYTASHAHDCSNIGGFGETSPETYHRALAFSQSATHTVGHNTVLPDHYQDYFGQPAPTLLNNWGPTLSPGTYTGTSQAAWSVAAGDSYVVYGGEFPRVNGLRQTGLTRFLGQPEAPDPAAGTTPDPTPSGTTNPTPTTSPGTDAGSAPARVSRPSAVALGPTRIATRWSAPKGAAADKPTAYVVRVYKGSKLVKSGTVSASTRLRVVSGLARATSYRVTVTARNHVGAGPASAGASVRTKADGKTVSAVKKPAKVRKPTANRGTTSLRVRWKGSSAPGALPVSKYEVRLVLRGKTIRTFVVDDKLRSKLSTGLKRNTGYTVSVRARNWAGWGGWSTGTRARTR